MMSHATQDIITIHILPNISRSNDNQAMKFGQLIAYKYFSSNIIQKKRQGDQSDLLSFFKKALNKVNK